MRACTIPDCIDKHYAKDLCRKHWKKQHYLGNEEYRIKAAERSKAYHHANKPKVKAYKSTNKEKISAQQKTYRKNNKEKIKNLRDEWSKNHSDYSKIWREKNRHLHNAKENKRRAAKLNNGIFIITGKELKRLYSSNCTICGSDENIHMDHIIPISKGGRHSIGNIQPLCRRCNLNKKDKLMIKWKQELKECG